MTDTIQRLKPISEIKKANSKNYYVSEFDMKKMGLMVSISLKPIRDRTFIALPDFNFSLKGVFKDLPSAINFIKTKYKSAYEVSLDKFYKPEKYDIIKIYDID